MLPGAIEFRRWDSHFTETFKRPENRAPMKPATDEGLESQVRHPPSPQIANWEELGEILSGSSFFCRVMSSFSSPICPILLYRQYYSSYI
jgi:hypothetical protein